MRLLSPFASACVLSILLFVVSSLSVPAQCTGTYFRPDYRAVNKLPAMHPTTQWVLQDWTGDGRSDFWNYRRNTITNTQDIVIYPALAAGYWDWDNPIVYTTTLPITNDIFTLGNGVTNLGKDFNSDGKMDLWIRYGNPTIERIHLNNGSGALVAQSQVTRPTGFWLTTGYSDLTGDGRLDWIYMTIESDERSIKYSVGNADGTFGTPNTIIANSPETRVNSSWAQAGDFDGDGKIDITYQGDGFIRLLRGQGGGVFTPGPFLTVPAGNSPATDDINGDGRADHYGLSGNQIRVMYGQSDGTFLTQVKNVSNVSTQWLSIAVADMNNDSRKDVIVISDKDYEVNLTQPSGAFTSQLYPRPLRYYTFQLLHFEDFNADGRADLVDAVQREHRLQNVYREEVMVIKRNFCDQKGQTRAPSFDGTPQPDLVGWNSGTGFWKSGNGDWNATGSVPLTSFNWGIGVHQDVPAPGDFDGDGLTDYTVYRNSDGNWYTFLSATSLWHVFKFGLPGDIAIPNDYDGGGKTDYAVFRPSDGNWYIWFNETQQFLALHWGASGDRPVPADFDGDGKTDVCVFRPSEGNWYYIRSSDSGFGIFHWGLDGDVPLPADYDGDAKADLAVFRSGTWHILRSTNGVYAPVAWGAGTDIPIPYLHRGEVAMPVAFRPSNSRWYHPQFGVGYALLVDGAPVYFGLPNN